MLPKLVSNAAIKFTLIIISFFLFVGCERDNSADHNATVPSNLDVVLRGRKIGLGHIEFKQDQNHIITLNTKVFNLDPNHSYLLQRAVDPLDYNCTSTTWLTLGKGLQPQAITTDSRGNGSAQLFRDVSAIPSGSTFDIHFQVVDATNSAVVLTSSCYQYMVR